MKQEVWNEQTAQNKNVTVEVNGEQKPLIKRDYAPHRRVSYRICKDCGKMYVLTDGDAMYFLEKYKALPLRCEDCRKKRHVEGYVAPEESK